MRMEFVLSGLQFCPHCGVAKPEMAQIMQPVFIARDRANYGHNWGLYRCTSCFNVVMAQSSLGNKTTQDVLHIYPSISEPAKELPERVRTYLNQANLSMHAPDGAAMLAGAAVDAMLKEKGYTKGSVYDRIDKALGDNILTQDMAEWAHDVRLGSNRPRHADLDSPHVSAEEAKQSVEFAEMLGHFLFVLPARVKNSAKKAKQHM